MNKGRNIILAILMCIGIISMLSLKAYAMNSSFNYSTDYYGVFSANISNRNKTSMAVYANTRPTEGVNGVVVTLAYTNGEVIKSEIFPYYTSRSDMVGYVGSGRIARLGVIPVVDGQLVKGTVHYRY